jgi:hypothetical protein
MSCNCLNVRLLAEDVNLDVQVAHGIVRSEVVNDEEGDLACDFPSCQFPCGASALGEHEVEGVAGAPFEDLV